MSAEDRLRAIERYLDRAKAMEGFHLSSDVAHNSTTGLQGGTTGEYYHLTQSQSLNVSFYHAEILQDSAGSILTDDDNNILYVEVL